MYSMVICHEPSQSYVEYVDITDDTVNPLQIMDSTVRLQKRTFSIVCLFVMMHVMNVRKQVCQRCVYVNTFVFCPTFICHISMVHPLNVCTNAFCNETEQVDLQTNS